MAGRGIGIVGCGRSGRLHASNLRLVPGLEAVAVADPEPDAARSLAERLGVVAAEDWRELCGRDDVEAVLICSPTWLHAEQVVAFAEAGKHVFCEKPLAAGLAEADAALAAVETAGVVLQLGYNRRFDANFAAAREAVSGGRVGRTLVARVTARDPEPPSRAYLEAGGRDVLFVDTTSHDLDLLRFVTGSEIVEVAARAAELLETGIPDTAVTTVTFDTGALGVVDNCWFSAYGYDQRLEVHGTEGAVEARNEARDTTVFADASGFHTPPLPAFFLERYAQTYVRELEAFADALGGGAVPVTGRDGRAALAAALAAARSAAEGRAVRVDELDA